MTIHSGQRIRRLPGRTGPRPAPGHCTVPCTSRAAWATARRFPRRAEARSRWPATGPGASPTAMHTAVGIRHRCLRGSCSPSRQVDW